MKKFVYLFLALRYDYVSMSSYGPMLLMFRFSALSSVLCLQHLQ